MRIGELAQRSGVAVETIRYYEAQGLLPAPLRLDNNYRNYTRKHLARLHFIRHCRLLDMSLEEIAKLTNLENAQPRDFEVVHETIGAHIRDIDNRIRELMELKQKLQALECHCTGNHEGKSCGILQELDRLLIPVTVVANSRSGAAADKLTAKSSNTSELQFKRPGASLLLNCENSFLNGTHQYAFVRGYDRLASGGGRGFDSYFFCWPLRSDATAAFDFIACQKWFRWRSVALSGRANRLAFDARLADCLYDE